MENQLQKEIEHELETSGPFVYHNHLGVRCTHNLLSNCSYNLNLSPVIIVSLDIIGL